MATINSNHNPETGDNYDYDQYLSQLEQEHWDQLSAQEDETEYNRLEQEGFFIDLA